MSKLYLVPTPVGNLEDMTFRAVNVLKSVDCILAEDTRTSAVLMKHYNIGTPLVSHHKFNEHKTSEGVAERILGGQDIALVTDAGTPGISDPGFLLVRTCVEKGVEVECLPGATAFVPALVNSGLPCERFTFEGFLPQKKGKNKKVQDLAEEERTMIFYESPFRLVKTLELFAQYFGEERQACVSREISKLHEENFRGTLRDCIEHFSQKDVKGEIVIVVEGKNRKVRNAENEEED
ncbi:MAG: 16S rRNA (cytidine(1402)-2'-O)-methyltransferase [Bacteroidales bacterium]|nr:16S rRNA (cytidine(1402)-2'-O)-methyltransferase [Bacteroidales bacterium]